MTEMSDAEVFGTGGGGQPEMSDADVFGAPQNAPVTGEGLHRSLEEGVQRGVAATAALPRLAADVIGAPIARGIQRLQNWTVDKVGLPENMRDTRDLANQKPLVDLPTYDRAREAIRKDFGGLPEYAPQNLPERALTTAGEMLPNVVGPGGLAAGAARALYPAAGAQTAHEAGLGPVGEAAGAFLGGARAGRVGAGRNAAQAPAEDELRDIAQTQGYRPATEAALKQQMAPPRQLLTPGMSITAPGGLQAIPGEAEQAYKTVIRTLDAQNIRPASAPKVYEALAPLENAKDMGDYLTARKMLGRVTGEQRHAALQARDMVDTALEHRMPGSINLLQTADKNWNVMRTAEDLSKTRAITENRNAGTHSGMNLGNKLRQMATNVLANEKRARYLSESDKKALTDLSRGTWTQDAMRWVGNFFGGGSGFGGILAGSATGAATGDPMTGVATALAGIPLKYGYNRSVANQANRARQQILSRSPEAVARGVQPPASTSSLPYGSLAGYLTQGQ